MINGVGGRQTRHMFRKKRNHRLRDMKFSFGRGIRPKYDKKKRQTIEIQTEFELT